MKKFAMLCSLLLATAGALGQPASLPSSPNGCGSGWNTSLVPDQIRVLNCTMTSSCNSHDACYGVCEGRTDGICAYQQCRTKGQQALPNACYSDPALIQSGFDAVKRRATCDARMADDIAAANGGRWACKAIAIIYREAVKLWGDGAWNGYGNGTGPAAWAQSQADYDAAIARFLAVSSDKDFEQFVKGQERATPAINFCGRLQFTPATGLTNVNAADKNDCKIALP